MGFAGTELDGVFGDVGGFDADVVTPGVVVEVGHLGGELCPGIPDDRAVGAGFGDVEGAGLGRVGEGDRGGGVEVRAVGLTVEGDDGFGLALAGVSFGFVEVLGARETGDGALGGVADGEIGVQGFFEEERVVARVQDREPDAEVAAEGDFVGQLEAVEAELAGGVVGAEGEGEVDVVADEGGESERPGAGAGETVGGGAGGRMHGRGLGGAEPGKDDRYAAANGLAVDEGGALRKEEDGA